MIIGVFQHVFSNVPREQSPSGQRGYQTLFYTQSGLSKEDLSILEDRAQSYTSEAGSIKYQFYTLPSNKAVITQMITLPELDEFGRKGRYLSHSLILSQQDFQLIECFPFAILGNQNFLYRLEDAFMQGDGKTGNIPKKEVNVIDMAERVYQLALSWQPEDQTRLARLGWQAEQIINNRQSVGIIGSTDQILGVLAVIFLLTVPRKRAFLSFDTNIYGCDWRRDWPFWAWGGKAKDDLRSDYLIDFQTRVVEANLALDRDTPFEQWVLTRIIPKSLNNYLDHYRWAEDLEQAIFGRPTQRLQTEDINASFFADFARINSAQIEKVWITHLPTPLSHELVRRIGREVTSAPDTYLTVMLTGIKPAEIYWFVYKILITLGAPPSRSDQTVLKKWIQISQDALLLCMPPLWEEDENSWRKALAALTAEDYAGLLRNLASWHNLPIPMWQAFVTPHEQIWIKNTARSLPPEDWKSVLPLIAKSGESTLDALVQIWPSLNQHVRSEIAHWCKGHKGRAVELRKVVEETFPHVKKESKWFDWFK